MNEVIMGLLGEAGPVTELSADIKVAAEIRIVVNQPVAKAFRGSTFQNAVKKAVHQGLALPHVANDVSTPMIDHPTLTVPVAKIVNDEVEKLFLEKAKMDQYRNTTNKATIDYKSARKTNLCHSRWTHEIPKSLKDISDD